MFTWKFQHLYLMNFFCETVDVSEGFKFMHNVCGILISANMLHVISPYLGKENINIFSILQSKIVFTKVILLLYE